VIKEFISKNDDNALIVICKKLPMFAGCWFEYLLFQHLRSSESLAVYCTTAQSSSSIDKVVFKYCYVTETVDSSNMQKGYFTNPNHTFQ